MSNSFIHSISAVKLASLSISFAMACAALCIFLISSEVNQIWMLAIHSSPILPPSLWALINLGGDAWVVLLTLLIIERRPGEVTSWVLKTWLLGAVLSQFIKHFYPLPRPASVLGLESLSLIDQPPLVSGSMPSGHALAAVSCALIACVLLRARGVTWVYLMLIAILAGLVAWARVAVGAHWPSDVIAGAGLALGVVVTAHVWERHHSWNDWLIQPRGHSLLIVLHILIALHLMVPQSEFILVLFVQFNLACLSLLKAFLLFKENFWQSH
jgi:membrane-associated phospholipid phosphatase